MNARPSFLPDAAGIVLPAADHARYAAMRAEGLALIAAREAEYDNELNETFGKPVNIRLVRSYGAKIGGDL